MALLLKAGLAGQCMVSRSKKSKVPSRKTGNFGGKDMETHLSSSIFGDLEK